MTAKAFYDGFYGDNFREFKKLGVETVRSLYEGGKFPTELKHNAAGEWLGRKARRAAIPTEYVSVAVSILALLATVYSALK